MFKISTRAIIILTVLTITIWIGYETYSTLTAVSKKVTVRQELLNELNKGENEEVVKDLDSRISY
jgi:hypothetical protein